MEFLIPLIVFLSYCKASQWQDGTIAVVEYHPIYNPALSKNARILANTAEYIKLMNSPGAVLDLIIFPEDTLRNDPETSVELLISDNPCENPNYPTFVKDLSCAAQNLSTYLVINLVSKVKCDNTTQSRNCQNHGYFFYNTNVVFDRKGTIVSLYHKYNLFGESQLDVPPEPEQVTIKTDFGPTLGIFTCFDILFKAPAQDLLEKKVNGVIFPSMWFSQLPFLTALQTQQMWAYAHNVTLFGSGANNPPVGSGGTGVFDGTNGAILQDIIAKGGSRVYVYEHGVTGKVQESRPVDALAKEMDAFHLLIDPSVREYNSTVLDTLPGTTTTQLCYSNNDHQICCNFSVKITVDTTKTRKDWYTYHLVAFSGVRSFNHVRKGGIEICAIIACLNSSLASCGRRFPNYDDIEWPIKFEEIDIKANFEIDENKTQYPNSLLSSIRPIPASQTLWIERKVSFYEKSFIERTFSLKESQDRILTFGIFGRNFAEDSPPPNLDESGSGRSSVSWILSITAITLAFFAFR